MGQGDRSSPALASLRSALPASPPKRCPVGWRADPHHACLAVLGALPLRLGLRGQKREEGEDKPGQEQGDRRSAVTAGTE